MGLDIKISDELNTVGIRQLWILNKSGLCVLHLNFTGKETLDESLVGGFFSVITTLINSTDDDLEEMSLNSTSVFIKNVNDLDFSIVIATNHKTNKKIIKKILSNISSNFYDDFNHIASDKRRLLSNEIFYSFSTKVVDIINNKGKTKKIKQSFLSRVQTVVNA